ncbi:MAG: DUF692 family protein [Oligoflexia bacterium]|nr:DUF692 family protein [Oligoflexia bacterium]
MQEKIKLSLTVSQHFNKVYPHIVNYTDALVVRDVNNIPNLNLKKSFHMNGFIDDDFDNVFKDDFFYKLKLNNINHLSFDLGPSCKKIVFKECNLADGPIFSKEQILEIGLCKIKQIRSKYNGIIALENLDYHEGGAYEHICDPDFINYFVRKLDVKLALDIGHMNVSSYVKGLGIDEYLRELPLDKLVELHVSHANKGDDTHGVLEESDYAIIDKIFSIKRPDFVVFEYFKDSSIIIDEQIKIYNFLRGHNNR